MTTLTGWHPFWNHCGTFLTHNWWHIALFYLKNGDFDAVLSLYDDWVWGRANQTYSQCLINAISLLVRLEVHGVDVGQRWHPVGPLLRDRLEDQVSLLLGTQYIYALACSGQLASATTLLASLQAHGDRAHASIQPIWQRVALPVAQAMLAHAQADWATAAQQFAIALHHDQILRPTTARP